MARKDYNQYLEPGHSAEETMQLPVRLLLNINGREGIPRENYIPKF